MRQSINKLNTLSFHAFSIAKQTFQVNPIKSAANCTHKLMGVCVCVTYILQYISHYTYVYTYHGWAYVFRLNAAFSLWFITAFLRLHKNATIEMHSKVKSIKFTPILFFSCFYKIYFQHMVQGRGEGRQNMCKTLVYKWNVLSIKDLHRAEFVVTFRKHLPNVIWVSYWA